jgi:hypothetical protein
MWNVKTKDMPVKIRATGYTSKYFRKCLRNLRESTKSKNYKKKERAMLGTAHILLKVCQSPKHSTWELLLHVA